MGDDQDAWQTVVDKKHERQRANKHKRKVEEAQKLISDINYLQNHSGFQKCRLTQSQVEVLIGRLENSKDRDRAQELARIYAERVRCRGHLFIPINKRVTLPLPNENALFMCLECYSTGPKDALKVTATKKSGSLKQFKGHCCCSVEDKSELQPFFYFGLDCSLVEYETYMTMNTGQIGQSSFA